MEDGRPCPDCQWTMYILTGRPVVFLRCSACHNWFHCNVKVKQSGISVAGQVTILDAKINQTCTKEMLNSLLRCDCLAEQVFLSHIAHCDGCGTTRRFKRGLGLPHPEGCTYSLRLLPKDTLHRFIVRMTKEQYKDSNLPAYTLQRRCGAVTAYFDRYLKEVATSPQEARARTYRKTRREIRDAHQD